MCRTEVLFIGSLSDQFWKGVFLRICFLVTWSLKLRTNKNAVGLGKQNQAQKPTTVLNSNRWRVTYKCMWRSNLQSLILPHRFQLSAFSQLWTFSLLQQHRSIETKMFWDCIFGIWNPQLYYYYFYVFCGNKSISKTKKDYSVGWWNKQRRV